MGLFEFKPHADERIYRQLRLGYGFKYFWYI